MSAAPAANPAASKAPRQGMKKLVLIIVGVAVVLLLAGVGALLLMQKNMASHNDEDAEGVRQVVQEAKIQTKSKSDASAPPIFVPLEPFIVNLADRETERFAQIGINLQVRETKVSDDMKLYMPAIRNAILLILSHKTAEELLTAEGKIQLAEEIRRGAARAMGYDIEEPDPQESSQLAVEREDGTSIPPKRRKTKPESYNPIVQVHYANFIIQ